MIPRVILFVLLATVVSSASTVKQLTPAKLATSISDNQFTMVYFYSATCSFCSQFSPKFEQLSKMLTKEGTVFGKIDAVAYTQVAAKYEITSYPTIALFWQNIDIPIFYTRERQVENLISFFKTVTAPFNVTIDSDKLDKLTKEQRESGVLFVGNSNSFENNVVSVLALVENFRGFARHEANVTKPYLEIKGEQHYDFSDVHALRASIRKAFARSYLIEEESWLRIHDRRDTGIVFVDSKNNEPVMQIINKLAAEMPDIVFMRLDPSQEQFREAVDALGIQSDQSIFGIDVRAKANFKAEKPFTEESIRTFISGVLNRSLNVYLRTEKSNHKQKLTRSNFEEKVNEPKDVVIFLYKDEDHSNKKFMNLFKFLTGKLAINPNISLLRCNLSRNEIIDKIGFEPKVTPWIIFYGHRMKNAAPVHFQNGIISSQTVIEFIMENTTFDWVEAEAEAEL